VGDDYPFWVPNSQSEKYALNLWVDELTRLVMAHMTLLKKEARW
jgi:hypothetical protein